VCRWMDGGDGGDTEGGGGDDNVVIHGWKGPEE